MSGPLVQKVEDETTPKERTLTKVSELHSLVDASQGFINTQNPLTCPNNQQPCFLSAVVLKSKTEGDWSSHRRRLSEDNKMFHSVMKQS